MIATLQRLLPFLGRRSKQRKSNNHKDSAALTCDETENDLSEIWTTLSNRDDGERRKEPQQQKSRLLNESYAQFRFKDEFVVNQDISNGREYYKIPALSHKRTDCAPSDFHYVTELMMCEPIFMDLSFGTMTGCECKDDCADGKCHCSSNHTSGRCYNSSGRLSSQYNVETPEMIYECNASCSCNRRRCQNSVIQNGCQVRLVLFRTGSRGWGVRTLENLKRGTFVGVYSGELVSALDSTKRQDDTYLFNLSSTSVIYTSEKQADQWVDTTETCKQTEQQMEPYVCDAKSYGNFTRFINHSCDPNVIGIRSFTEHHDSRFPYISFFTNKDVPANSELTLNYGDNYWLVKCKRDNVFCLCRKSNCRFSKKAFPETFKQHQDEQRRKSKRGTK